MTSFALIIIIVLFITALTAIIISIIAISDNSISKTNAKVQQNTEAIAAGSKAIENNTNILENIIVGYKNS